jgi:hypothetical protein
MAEQDFVALAERLNVATNKIAAKIESLKAEVLALTQSAGLPAEKEAEIAAKFDAAIAPLEALGADAANPVPDDVPEV